MPLIGPAPGEVRAVLEDVLAEYHPELAEAGVTINLLFANSTGNGPAVKLHGYPCAAVVKINGLKARVEGVMDATITIDGDAWPDWSTGQRKALIDHELYHLELAHDAKTGNYKYDDAGRPKLKMRNHDWQMGGFDAIARRHGQAAFEVQAVRVLATERGQMFWAWGDDTAPQDEAPRPRMAV